MTLSEKILHLRKQNGLSQEAFAEKLGVSRQSVSKWESGAAVPDVDKVIAMSEIFGVSTDELLKNEPVTEQEQPASDIEDTQEFNLPEETFAVIPPEVQQTVPQYAPVQPETLIQKPKKNKRKIIIAVVAAVLSLCIVVTSVFFVVPLFLDKDKEKVNAATAAKKKIDYPYVLVHGLGGYGDDGDLNDIAPYWGAETGSLVEYLTSEGYEVYAPSIGPVSSAWDRACELYAQLTGTVVDYGDNFLVYMVTQAYYPSLSILEKKLQESFESRVNAIYNWFLFQF